MSSIACAILLSRKSDLKRPAGISSFSAKGRRDGYVSLTVCITPTQICCCRVRLALDNTLKNKPAYLPRRLYLQKAPQKTKQNKKTVMGRIWHRSQRLGTPALRPFCARMRRANTGESRTDPPRTAPCPLWLPCLWVHLD